MCAAPRICELAIAGAYVVLDHPKPEQALAALVRGYQLLISPVLGNNCRYMPSCSAYTLEAMEM